MSQQIAQPEGKSFIKMVPVINIDFLDRSLVEQCLEQCYVSVEGDQDYIEWDTNWSFSTSSTQLSNHLVSRGAPKGKRFLLKLTREE